jgi:hypothetical protein
LDQTTPLSKFIAGQKIAYRQVPIRGISERKKSEFFEMKGGVIGADKSCESAAPVCNKRTSESLDDE